MQQVFNYVHSSIFKLAHPHHQKRNRLLQAQKGGTKTVGDIESNYAMQYLPTGTPYSIPSTIKS